MSECDFATTGGDDSEEESDELGAGERAGIREDAVGGNRHDIGA